MTNKPDCQRFVWFRVLLPHRTLLSLQQKGLHGFPTIPLYISVHLVLVFHLLPEMPITRKVCFPQGKAMLTVLILHLYTCPHPAQLTWVSNLVLLWEYMGRACFKSFFASLEAGVCNDRKDLMLLVLHCLSDCYSDRQPFMIEWFQRKSRETHPRGYKHFCRLHHCHHWIWEKLCQRLHMGLLLSLNCKAWGKGGGSHSRSAITSNTNALPF